MTHYFSEKQDSKLILKKINIKTKKISFDLYTSNGVFSKEHLDKGTELLLNEAILKDNCSVLDLGCGIGVVGIYVKLLYPNTNVLMSDINERAVYLARKNIELHKLEKNNLVNKDIKRKKNIEARKSDIFSNIKENFDIILLNPPQTAGKEICFKMIEESFLHLNKNGLFQLVARHKKGGLTLSKKMLEVFGNLKVIAQKSGFKIYLSEKI
ncbi:MAG: methyltransferase [Candidatus Woesearchaeota archaeon]